MLNKNSLISQIVAMEEIRSNYVTFKVGINDLIKLDQIFNPTTITKRNILYCHKLM